MNPSSKRKIEYRKMRSAFESLDWPVPTPQKFHHWTLAHQVNQLVTAREADPDLGFIARMLALCSLPRTNPGRRTQYVRRNGPYTLGMAAGINNKLPYGNLPRLLLAWVCTEAVRTQRRELILAAVSPSSCASSAWRAKAVVLGEPAQGSATRWNDSFAPRSRLSTRMSEAPRVSVL